MLRELALVIAVLCRKECDLPLGWMAAFVALNRLVGPERGAVPGGLGDFGAAGLGTLVPVV